jgi:hypothetical protein
MTTSPQRINPLFFVAIAVLIVIIIALSVAQNNYRMKQMVAYCENNLSMTFYEYSAPYFYCAEYPNGIMWNGTPIKIVEIRIR